MSAAGTGVFSVYRTNGKQVRVIYDEWLAKALPQLSEEQLIAATAQSENVKFDAGQIIFRQGDPSDKFYIITKGQVDVLRMDKRSGQETQVARLAEGQYFGEIGLLGRTERTATVKAVTPGAVDTEVIVELAPGIEIVSIITKKSAESLGLKPGAKAYAVIKASNVIIGPKTGYSNNPPGVDFIGAGQRETQNELTLDGVSIMNNLGNVAPARPSTDMISEVQMQSGNYTAQYGAYLGVHINMVSKGGTNQYHGVVYDYIGGSPGVVTGQVATIQIGTCLAEAGLAAT